VNASVPNRRIFIYALLFTLNAINYIDRVNLSVAAKPIATAFHLSPVAMGYLFSSFTWTYTLFLIPVGMLVDRWGTRFVAACSVAVWSVGSMLTGAVGGFGGALATRLLLGAGEAATNPAGYRVVREWMPVAERGGAAATFHAGSFAGPAVGAIFVAWLITEIGWRGSFIVTGLFGFVWLGVWLAFFRKPEDARWLGETERATILAGRDAAPDELDGKRAGSIPALLRCRSMWGIALTQGCYVYSQYFFLTWLPTYLQTVRHMSLLGSGVFTALPYAISVVLVIAIGRSSDRLLSAKAVASGGRRVYVAGALLVSSVVIVLPFVDALWLAVALITVSLTFISTASAMNFALTNDLLRTPGSAGKAIAVQTVGGNIFGLVAPIVTGYVVSGTGSFTGAFAIAGGLLLAGAAISMTMTRGPIFGTRDRP
jgi:MFS family permease